MRPFPDPKVDPLAPDPDLQQAFDDAMNAMAQPPRGVPIAIVALNDSAPHSLAGQRLTEVHYSASLLKVAAMYAAFELRKAANDLLLVTQPPPADVLPALRNAFDDVIKQHRVKQLLGLDPSFLLPRYDQVFTADSATPTVNFSPGFFGSMFDAIADGDNAAAGACVHGLGFGYLTKAVSEAGFFDPDAANQPATADGMWLCGDFGNGFPPQRIPCLNDTPVAQATSVRQMARLFTLLAGNTVLVDGASDGAMLHLLDEARNRGHFFLSRDTSVHFATVNTKIGLGPLNNGTSVASEAAIIGETSTGRSFVVVFQNRTFVNDASLLAVSRVIDDAIARFLFP